MGMVVLVNIGQTIVITNHFRLNTQTINAFDVTKSAVNTLGMIIQYFVWVQGEEGASLQTVPHGITAGHATSGTDIKAYFRYVYLNKILYTTNLFFFNILHYIMFYMLVYRHINVKIWRELYICKRNKNTDRL